MPKANFLVFPDNVGVSQGANAVKRQVSELQGDALGQSITIGKHYKETQRSLASAIQECSSEGWDGYGAKEIDEASVESAISFARMLPMSIPSPEVYVDTDGEVTFEWFLGPRRVFSVTVEANGKLVFAGLFGVSKIHGTEYFDDDLPETILDNIARVSS